MTEDEAAALLSFVKLLHNQCISLSSSLRFDKSFQRDGALLCLYGTLLEYTASFITLVDSKQRVGASSVFRSLLEAFADFINLNNDPSYIKHCLASDHEQWIKALKASKGGNP